MFPVSLGRSWETGAGLDLLAEIGPEIGQAAWNLNMLISRVRALLPVETGSGELVCLLLKHASQTWSCTDHFHS